MRPLKNSFQRLPALPRRVVEWTLQDCVLRGGKVNLGLPDDNRFYHLIYTN